MRGTSLHNSNKYAKPLNFECWKSCSVAVYCVSTDDGKLLIHEWERSLLKETDGLMPWCVILVLSSH